VRVPDEAGNGKAKVTVSFAAWKVRPVKATTTEVTVGEKHVDGNEGVKATSPKEKQKKKGSQQGSIRVKVDGRDATPEEKEAFGALLTHLFSQAINQAVKQSMDEASERLHLDDIEKKLIFGQHMFEPAKGGTISVYLVRPGKPLEKPQLTVLTLKDKPFLRFARTIGPVHQPIAVVTRTALVNGQLSISELFLVYDPDGEWKQQDASKRIESLRE